jgi:hypothetical protein
MKLLSLLLTALVISSIPVYSQSDDYLLPEGLGFSNQLEYSYDVDLKRETLENWMNLDYRKGIFGAGIRFDIFQPNDPDPSISRGKRRFSDIAFKYIKADIGDFEKGIDITAGNYYALFGRGMILKSYEDRNIRVDNNLLGLKVTGRFNNFILTALSGMPANAADQRNEILHAADLEYRGLDFMKIGGTFASNQPDQDNVARTMMSSLRIQPSFWNFDLYSEFGVKQNEDVMERVFNNNEKITGKGFYSNLNFYYESFSVSGEYKIYDNFAFQSSDGTVDYNTPPALRKDYTYMLLNRHPSPLNAADEKGFNIDVNYSFSAETYLNAIYGETESLPPGSYYQRVLNRNIASTLQLREMFAQLVHTWNDRFMSIAAFGYNEEGSTNTKSITPILENRWHIDNLNTLRLVIEHQQVEDNNTSEFYYDDVFTIEYLRSPKWSVAFVTEMQTKEPEEGNVVRKFWNFIQFAYKIGEHTDLSVLFGSRQAGNICIGGVCRYEPEFSGIELKMFTRL